jgi:hypothetical protein
MQMRLAPVAKPSDVIAQLSDPGLSPSRLDEPVTAGHSSGRGIKRNGCEPTAHGLFKFGVVVDTYRFVGRRGLIERRAPMRHPSSRYAEIRSAWPLAASRAAGSTRVYLAPGSSPRSAGSSPVPPVAKDGRQHSPRHR